MLPGHRYTLLVHVERVTHYQRKTWDRESEETAYRYYMHDQSGEHYAFTGRYIYDFEIGNTYEVRATVKEYETPYHCWRLKRLQKIRKIHDGEMLSFSA